MAVAPSNPPRIAVVTPYWREDEVTLRRCIDSVAQQTLAADHLLIADGMPQRWVDDVGVRHIILDRNHGDWGNVARGTGAVLAAGEAYDAIAMLDADNAFDPDHLALCMAAAQGRRAAMVAARRRFVLPDGTPVDADDTPGLVDTNVMLLLPRVYPLLSRWTLIPKDMSGVGDRIFHAAVVAQRLRIVTTDRPSVTYTSRVAAHYRAAGRTPPADARDMGFDAIARWAAALSPAERTKVEYFIGLKLTVGEGASEA